MAGVAESFVSYLRCCRLQSLRFKGTYDEPRAAANIVDDETVEVKHHGTDESDNPLAAHRRFLRCVRRQEHLEHPSEAAWLETVHSHLNKGKNSILL